MLFVTNRGKIIVALVIVFGVLAYLAQGEQRDIAPTGGDKQDKAAVRVETAKPATPGATAASPKTAPATTTAVKEPRAEDILKGAQSKATGKTSVAFFTEYRLERDRNRSKQIQLLKGILDGSGSANDSRQEAQKRLVELTQQMDLELQLEKLIVAKGYTEAAVFIMPQAVSVLVQKTGFNQEDANRIGDLICRATGRAREQVSIIPFI